MGCWEDAKRRSYTGKFKLMAVEVVKGNLRKQASCIDTASQLNSLAVQIACFNSCLVPKLASKVDVEGRRKAERD